MLSMKNFWVYKDRHIITEDERKTECGLGDQDVLLIGVNRARDINRGHTPEVRGNRLLTTMIVQTLIQKRL